MLINGKIRKRLARGNIINASKGFIRKLTVSHSSESGYDIAVLAGNGAVANRLITATTPFPGRGTLLGGGTVSYGSAVTLVAIANPGFEFAGRNRRPPTDPVNGLCTAAECDRTNCDSVGARYVVWEPVSRHSQFHSHGHSDQCGDRTVDDHGD